MKHFKTWLKGVAVFSPIALVILLAFGVITPPEPPHYVDTFMQVFAIACGVFLLGFALPFTIGQSWENFSKEYEEENDSH